MNRDAQQTPPGPDQLLQLRKQQLREKVAQGLDSLERGKGIDGEEFFAHLEQEESHRQR